MHANTRGRLRTAGTHTSRPGTCRAAIGAILALGLAAACSTSSEAEPDRVSPTFARANGGAMLVEEPVANVTDLVAPAGEGEPWTIVGSIFDPENRSAEAAVWTSDDGRRWESTTIPPARDGTNESLAAATSTEGGMIAVGQVGDGAAADAAVWRLVDGDWERGTPEVMAGDHEQWAFKVVTGPSGTLVAGGENVWGEVRPRLWFSADGETWESVDGGAGGPLDDTGEESVRDIAAVGDGFVAVGSRTVDNEQDGLAWYSPDGISWEGLDTPTLGGPNRQEVLTVTATDGLVVAGGYSSDDTGQGQPLVWRSPDGRTWGPAVGPLPMEAKRNAASDLAVRSVTIGPAGQGLIAAGGSEWRPHVWHSTDSGVSWVELPNPVHGKLFQSGIALRDAAGDGSIVVALGTEPTVALLDGPRWQDVTGDAFPAGGEQPFVTTVAAGPGGTIAAGGRYTAPSGEARESYRGQVWQRDGDTWAEVDSAQLSAGRVMDAVPITNGFVAVGFEDFGVAEGRETLGDPEPDGVVWVTENGTDWARIGTQSALVDEASLAFLDDPSPETAAVIAQMEAEAPPESAPPAGGDGTRSLSAVAPLGDGFLAVGSAYVDGDADPVIVASGDGREIFGENPVHTGAGIQRYNDVCIGPGDAAVAVGATGSAGSFDAIVATRDPATGVWTGAEGPFTGAGEQLADGCAASDDGFVVVGSDDSSGNRDARVWTSDDGVTWTELESALLGGSGDQWASTAVPAPDGGWLVGGTDTASGDADIALWRITADGDVSRRDQGETALGGPGDQSVTNIAIDEDGRVALAGHDYGRVGLWQSDVLDR